MVVGGGQYSPTHRWVSDARAIRQIAAVEACRRKGADLGMHAILYTEPYERVTSLLQPFKQATFEPILGRECAFHSGGELARVANQHQPFAPVPRKSAEDAAAKTLVGTTYETQY